MARIKPCSNSVPRVELDHRARDARLRLVRIEQLLVPRAGKGFRLFRLFAWRLYPQPKAGRTPGSLSRPRGGSTPEIDVACQACPACPA